MQTTLRVTASLRAGGAVRLASLEITHLLWLVGKTIQHAARDTTLRKTISASCKDFCAFCLQRPEDKKEVVDQAEKLIFDNQQRCSEQGIEDTATDFEELQQNTGKDASELGVQTDLKTQITEAAHETKLRPSRA